MDGARNIWGRQGWNRSGSSPILLETYLWDVLRGWAGREIGVVYLETSDACPNAVGELTNEGVVVGERVVIAFACHADAVLGAGELVLQAHKLVARAELWIVFRKQQ